MENDNKQAVPSNGQPQLETWQDYYQYAQQLYEAGDEKQAQVYYAIAQQMYEASDDDIGAQTGAAEQAPQPLGSEYTDINTIGGAAPSIPPEPTEKRVSQAALKDWAEEITSMAPEPYDHAKHAKRNKALLLGAAGLVVVIAVVVGIYIYKLNQPTIVQSSDSVSQSNSSIDPNSFTSSKPSSIHNSWNRERPPGAVRGPRPRKGKGGGRQAGSDEGSDDSLKSPKQKKQKNLSGDPLSNFEL